MSADVACFGVPQGALGVDECDVEDTVMDLEAFDECDGDNAVTGFGTVGVGNGGAGDGIMRASLYEREGVVMRGSA